jgi:hypothetical protein
MDEKKENNIVELNKQLNKKIEICKDPNLSENKFGLSVIQINEILFNIYDEIKNYTSGRPKKLVFVELKRSLESLSGIEGFVEGTGNATFDVFKKAIIGKIDDILITPVEHVPPPMHIRSISVRPPRPPASAGGKTKTKTKNKTKTKTKTKKNKTNKKR